jgi:hypothetical protein
MKIETRITHAHHPIAADTVLVEALADMHAELLSTHPRHDPRRISNILRPLALLILVSLAPRFTRYTVNCISHMTLGDVLNYSGCVCNRSA